MESRRSSSRLKVAAESSLEKENTGCEVETPAEGAGLKKRLARGEGQKNAFLAVRAFYSPATADQFSSKSEAAAAFGVSRQLFRVYESELSSSGVLEEIQGGKLPDVPLPSSDASTTNESAPGTATCTSSDPRLDMDKVKEQLAAQCCRLGDSANYGSHGTVGMYREGLKWAVELMHKSVLPRDGRQASRLLATIDVHVSHMTLHSKLREVEDQDELCILTPRKAGIQSKIPYRYELELAKYVQTLRALKLKAGKSLMIGAANFLIRETSYAELFKSKEVRYGWYYSFRQRWGIKVKNQTRLEMDRARWTTANHLKDWYDVVMEGMVACGIAVANEHFNPELPYDTMFYITDPDMVYEWDQTGFSLDQTEDGKGPTEKTMTIDSDDNGECVANKSNVRWTLTGGSFLTGDSLPGCATPGTQGVKLSLLKDPPLSTIIDPATKKGRPCQFYPHQSGGFTYELAPQWMRQVVGPCLPKKEGKRAYGLCDGYGAHTTLPMVQAANEVGSDLQLRVPHTSHVSQVADVANFPLFKQKAKQAKSDLLVAKVMGGKPPRLTSDDMPAIIKVPWEEAFHPEVSRKGWREIGFDPATKSCNRKLFWDLKAKEEAVASKLQQVGADDAVLDIRCQQFKQGKGGHALGDGGAGPDSDSSDSGDSDSACNVDNLRLGAEDFMLGPLTYGAGRAKLEERFKRKQEQETLKQERAQKRSDREKQVAEQRQHDARAAARILWDGRARGIHSALQKLQKKHLAALLILTQTSNIKGSETNAVLMEAMTRKLSAANPEETITKLRNLVNLFLDLPEETTVPPASRSTQEQVIPSLIMAEPTPGQAVSQTMSTTPGMSMASAPRLASASGPSHPVPSMSSIVPVSRVVEHPVTSACNVSAPSSCVSVVQCTPGQAVPQSMSTTPVISMSNTPHLASASSPSHPVASMSSTLDVSRVAKHPGISVCNASGPSSCVSSAISFDTVDLTTVDAGAESVQ